MAFAHWEDNPTPVMFKQSFKIYKLWGPQCCGLGHTHTALLPQSLLTCAFWHSGARVSHIGPVFCVQPVGLQPDVQCWVVLCMERPSPLNCAFSPSGECAALSLVFTFQKLYILSQEVWVVSHKLITHSRESPLSTPERQQALDSQPPNLLLPGSPSVLGAPAVLNPS